MPMSWTGDPQVDAQILAQLSAQYGNIYNRQHNAMLESLASRNMMGGGQEYSGTQDLLQQRGSAEYGAATDAAHAAAERYQRQREIEQGTQNQMRLMEYQARLNRQRKMSPMQRALMYGGSGATIGAGVGSMFPGAGTAIGAGVGGLAGGLYGYFGNE